MHSPVLGAVGGHAEFDLDAVHTVDAVNEENEDEDKRDLHPVLDLGNDRILRDEAIAGETPLVELSSDNPWRPREAAYH